MLVKISCILLLICVIAVQCAPTTEVDTSSTAPNSAEVTGMITSSAILNYISVLVLQNHSKLLLGPTFLKKIIKQ